MGTASEQTALPAVSELSSGAIHTEPQDFDFSEGYCETWEVVFPDVDDWSIEQ